MRVVGYYFSVTIQEGEKKVGVIERELSRNIHRVRGDLSKHFHRQYSVDDVDAGR